MCPFCSPSQLQGLPGARSVEAPPCSSPSSMVSHIITPAAKVLEDVWGGFSQALPLGSELV